MGGGGGVLRLHRVMGRGLGAGKREVMGMVRDTDGWNGRSFVGIFF